MRECLRTFSGDADEDGIIRVSELQEHVISRVRELTDRRQNPTLRQENLAEDFVLVTKAEAEKKP